MRKFPFYKQHDAMQCGITCLKMICEYYGKKYSLDELSLKCIPTKTGISLLGISDGATSLGFHSVCNKMTLNYLKSRTTPCILHWNQNHFVVLYKIKRNKKKGDIYYVADPGKDLLIYTEEEFCSKWFSTQSNGEEKGVGLFLDPTPLFYKTKDKNKSKRSFGFLFGYIKLYKHYFGQIILGLIVGSLLQLLFPFLTQTIVDIGITHKDINLIYLILLAQLFLVISRTTVDFIRRWILLHISMRINISLVSDFFIKLLKLPMGFFDTKLLGDLMQRINDHSRIEKFLTNQALSVMFSLVSLFVFSIVLLSYSWLIFVVFFIGSTLYIVWIMFFLKKRKVIDYETFEKQSDNNNKTYQFITSMQEIKLQGCEQRRRWEWEDVQVDLFNVQLKSLRLQQTQEAGSILINEIKNIIVTILAATAVISGNLTLGMMLAISYIIGQLNSPIDQLMSFLYSLQDVKISLERINEIHETKKEDKYIGNTTFEKDKSISIKNIEFKYSKHKLNNVLDNISFNIPEGKITAIVGASGSGKTTLIKLLLGYYSVDKGDILIGNETIEHFNLKWWRKQCGVVMQDGIIFSESIARNIAVDDNDIDTNKLWNAAHIANVHEFIMHLPLKYNSIIGSDGVGLSQGQKQRILIARAVYKDPEYIFLDEATNALDANNEKIIVENLNKFYEGKTVIIVAHRLSTVKNADQIIVMDNGKIAEVGDHLSLVRKEGIYFNLVKNQLELGN